METASKLIGTIIWFRDKSKNANFGFIKSAKLGDIFFHERSIVAGQNLHSFKEGEVVIFTTQESKKYKDKIEAIQVILLENENDVSFLLNCFLDLLNQVDTHHDFRKIESKVSSKISLDLNQFDVIKRDYLYGEYSKKFLDQLKTNLSFEVIKNHFKLCKNFFPERLLDFYKKSESFFDAKTAHNLWLHKYTTACQVDYISKIILTDAKTQQQLIFSLCTDQDKINIFKSLIKTELKTNSCNELKEILHLSLMYAGNFHDEILENALKTCSTYQKLILWLEGFHEDLCFEDYKVFTTALNPANQKKFVKKTLQYIHKGKQNITLEQFISIKTVDYQISKSIESTDFEKIDYSTSIILNVILELSKKPKISTSKQIRDAQHTICNIVLNQIKNPDDILEIHGYFDECKGRCYAVIKDGVVSYGLNKEKSRFTPTICDGRKYLNKDGDPVLCERTNLEFWWCANRKCYSPSRKLHSSEEWESYTLLDFLTILKIDFVEKDLEIYLNVINKANTFLKHFKCRKCEHILRPTGKSNYAFYGVNNFECTNSDCEEHGQKIYLTHCLNGRCGHLIDSRDAAKCKNGWYICNYCHSCCSTQQIESRVRNLESRGQSYEGDRDGHRDLGLFFCDKCGGEMINPPANFENYNEILKWFVDNKNNSEYIGKYGENRYHKKWFIFKKHDLTDTDYKERLKYYFDAGFQIPDIDVVKNYQLISESNKDLKKEYNEDLLVCQSCQSTLNLSNDMERSSAIRYFHSTKFKFPSA